MMYPSGGEPSEFMEPFEPTSTAFSQSARPAARSSSSRATTLAASRVETAKQMLDQLEMTAAALRAKSLAFQHQKEAHEKFLQSAKLDLEHAATTRAEELESKVKRLTTSKVQQIKRLLGSLRDEQGTAREALSERQALEDALDNMSNALKKSNSKIKALTKKL